MLQKCEDVCEDVASTQSEIKCTTENTEVEKCGFTPKQTCQEVRAGLLLLKLD